MNKMCIQRRASMNKTSMLEILERLNWTRADLARRVGIDPHTVSRWDDVPGPVAAYLELADKVNDLSLCVLK